MSLFCRKHKYASPYYGGSKPLLNMPSQVPLRMDPVESSTEVKNRKQLQKKEELFIKLCLAAHPYELIKLGDVNMKVALNQLSKLADLMVEEIESFKDTARNKEKQ